MYICPDIDICLEHLKTNSELAVAVSHQHATNCQRISQRYIFCLSESEKIYSFTVSMLTRKRYERLPVIDKIIRRSLESGLFQKWQKDSEMKKLYRSKHELKAVRLNLEHIGGGVVALGFCFPLCLLTGCVEHLVYRKARLPNCSTFWKLADQFMDGDRHYFKDEIETENENQLQIDHSVAYLHTS